MAGALAVAGLGVPLVMGASLPAFLAGLALLAVGTFAAQAAVTGFVGRAATHDRGGLYLASYFLGGLVGSASLGRLFDAYGWPACVAGVAAALLVAGLLSLRLRLPEA